MKRLVLLFLSMFFILGNSVAQSNPEMPEISKDGQEFWYYIQFKKGLGVLQDMGENALLLTKKPELNNNDQLWKITEKDGKYILTAKSGRVVVRDEAYELEGRTSQFEMFLTSSTQSAFEFGLLESVENDYLPAWELYVYSEVDDDGEWERCLNQFEGAGYDRMLSSYYWGDGGNPLAFIAEDEMQNVIDPIKKFRPQISDSGQDYWYYIIFKRYNSDLAMQNMGDGEVLRIQTFVDKQENQMFKFTGTEDNYIIEGKGGVKLAWTGSRFVASSTDAPVAFRLNLYSAANYGPAVELQRIAVTNVAMNPNGGSGVNAELSEYYNGDGGNAVMFVPVDDNTAITPVDADGTYFFVENGYIKAVGIDEPIEVYNVVGRKINSDKQLSKGVYVVKTKNKSTKVIVH